MHPPGIACLAWKQFQTGDSAQMVYIASYVPFTIGLLIKTNFFMVRLITNGLDYYFAMSMLLQHLKPWTPH